MSLDQNCRTVTTKCWLFLPSKLCIVKFSDFAGTLSPIFCATRWTWSMWSSTSTFWTPSSTGGSQSLGQGWPGSEYVWYMYSSHYFFCRWLASSETHSVLPDVFPTVSNHFLSNNWNLDYLKILPFAQMTGCTWQQFGSGGHPEVLGFPFLHQFMTISAIKLNQKFLDAMQ